MPRGGGKARPGSVYHLISRFTAKEWFIESTVERRTYLSLLGLAMSESDWSCFCYAVMSSHIHLGLVAGTTRLARWLRPMHTTFATWLNVTRNRIGGVFVKGPNLIELMPHETGRLIDYVHHNPVRAGVVARPQDSDWTSQRPYLGLAQRPHWLQIDRGLELSGFVDGSSLAAWSERAQTTRADLDACRVTPIARPGRPRQPEQLHTASPRSGFHAGPLTAS